MVQNIFAIVLGSAILFSTVYCLEDAVVIEATDASNQVRSTKNLILANSDVQPYAFSDSGVIKLLAVSNGLGTCFSNKGVLGKCKSFRQCYPYFKLPELGNWETWILGMYDTCSYFTSTGQQMFGICCTNPTNLNDTLLIAHPPVEQPDANKQPETTTKQTTPAVDNENKLVPIKVESKPFANWPPPIPTHPPDHTIPPLPTHPPFLGYPTHPTVSTAKPVTTTKPTKRPWPPTQAPTITTSTTSSSINSYGACGSKNQDQERIVGGHDAEVGEWPWIAALFNGGRQFCGGSLIDDIHILSAAHCVAHMSSWDVARLTVRLGDYNIKTNSEIRHIEKKVKRVVRHKGFDSRTLYNDIAILTMDSPVKFNQQIRPVCLPTAGTAFTGRTATVIGWGSLREAGPQPAVLQEVNIPIWSNSECRQKYGNAAPGGIVEHMLCAGKASKDSCSGDSGGPLMVGDSKWTQVGIVSWGIGCGKGQYPGVYTRVTNFLPWIKKNLK